MQSYKFLAKTKINFALFLINIAI